MDMSFQTVWFLLIAVLWVGYFILEGFDFGVGMLVRAVSKNEADRRAVLTTLGPVWDGNEVWLLVAGGATFAAFPEWYATLFSGFYLPLFLILVSLIVRGVAFEFRWKTKRGQFLWDWAFAGGSTIASFAQGIALGALVQGIPVEGRVYSGGWWNWLTPFSVLTGVALVIGYTLLGATWLIWKTEGQVQDIAYRTAKLVAPITVILIGIVSIWTPFLNDVPLFVLLSTAVLLRGLYNRLEISPFLASISLFILSFIGLGISFYPHIVPNSVTIWEAAAPDNSLGFLLAGASVLIPVVLSYTAYAYWVFRGKVNSVGGYH